MPSNHSLEFASLRKGVENEINLPHEKSGLSFSREGVNYVLKSGSTVGEDGQIFYSFEIQEEGSLSGSLIRHVWMKQEELTNLMNFARVTIAKNKNIKETTAEIQDYINTYSNTHRSANIEAKKNKQE